MQKSLLRYLFTAGVAALFLALGTSAFAQGVTTSGITGFVTDNTGKPVAGATITVLHVASGTRASTTTRPNGQYNLSGLRVGGPYAVTVDAKTYQPQSRNDVFLSLNEEQAVSFALSTEVVTMEAVRVTATRDTTFDVGRMSSNMSFAARQIASTPSVRQDVQDIANLDSRISLTENTTQIEFAVSAQGQNSRFNSFLIDGVQANDPFGLNANGFSSLRSPVPLDALAALSIDLSPYDATRTGFTGALINAVIKSGTNEFHGSLYGYYTGKSLRGKNPLTHAEDQLQERSLGASIGGPIIRNKLFFYLHWLEFKRTSAAPGQTFLPSATAIDQITAAAQAFGYDPGTISASDTVAQQKTYLAKIDWNITEGQRATFTYLRTDSGTPNFADFSGSTYTSLSNHWYQARRVRDSYNLQLNSQWTSNFRTDAGAQYSKYNGTAAPNGAPFPEVYVNGVTGTNLVTGAPLTGQVDMGTNYSYQLNALYTKNYNGHIYGEYSLGDHTFKFGGDMDRNQYDDRFVQYYYGRYAFASIADFAAGMANYLRYQQPIAGFTIPNSFAHYTMADFGLLAQDTWRPAANLTISAGLRLDYPLFDSRPPYNGAFFNTFGFRNNTYANGNYTIAPRLGFNYTLPRSFLPGVLGGRKTQIRGGGGLFQGTNPAVWVANSYQTAGLLNSVILPTSSAGTTSTVHGTIAFHADPSYVQTLPPPATPQASINVTDPDFRTPTSWKSNLAVDHALPWLDLVATVEANFINVQKGLTYQSINLNQVGTLPDGRNLYAAYTDATTGKTHIDPATNKTATAYLHPNFATVLDLTNTNQGGSQAYTVALSRPMKNHWSFGASYTHTHATEVQPFTSSVATSNFNYRAIINPNDNIAWNSSYVVPHKLVVAVTREFDFFHRPNSATSVTAILRVQSGHAYSWVFGNAVNGDDYTGFNEALYVPSGPTDPKVSWTSTTERDAFFAFVASNKDLRGSMGRIVSPNSSFNPMQHTIDLHLEQEIPLYRDVRFKVFVDCLNFANLLNRSWGAVTGLDFGTGSNAYNRLSGVTATYNPTTSQYVYRFNAANVSPLPPFTDLSRWQLQVGAKLEF